MYFFEKKKILVPNPIIDENDLTSNTNTNNNNDNNNNIINNNNNKLNFDEKSRPSDKMRKSKSILKELIPSSQKLSSKKISLYDMMSSKSIGKCAEQFENIYKLDLDVLNNFTVYFPGNNASNIIPKLKYEILDVESPSSSAKRKRNNTRRMTKTKTMVIRKESAINSFEKNMSFQGV